MATYMLRLRTPADAALWEAVTARAKADGFPLRAVILTLLRLYADGTITVEIRASHSDGSHPPDTRPST